jgi:hypothetical protein
MQQEVLMVSTKVKLDSSTVILKAKKTKDLDHVDQVGFDVFRSNNMPLKFKS